MHHPVAEVREGELPARRAQVALLVVIRLVVSVLARGHAEGTDVEFTPVDEQRVVDVLLHDAGAFARARAVNDDALDVFEVLRYLDAHAAVRALAGFQDPDVGALVVLLVVLFEGVPVGVVKAVLDVEGHGQGVEGVLAHGLVVIFHIEKNEIEIAYFGVLEEYQNKKLGSYLLSEAIKKSFENNIRRVWLHTCSTDHKNALNNYIARGMKIFKSETVII